MADTPHSAATPLTDELRRAFHLALYRYAVPGGELLLEIDRHSEPLRQLLLAHGAASAAAITAYNPGSQQRDEHSNLRAQQQLEGDLQALELPCFPGRHEDPADQWPAEISALALGLSCAAACRIAARYGQLAIVWSDAGGTPRLIEIASQQAAAVPGSADYLVSETR
jgi:Protein of unknown function (DUF3293)